MNKDILQKARDYEAQYKKSADSERPQFHLTGPIGWINDPNGFSLYKGEYHLFFQYHPYDTQWGPMHWGHAKTKDFVKWEYLPAALAPDTDSDCFGCFSGSAIETVDGKHLLMYTGVCRKELEDGSCEERQQQCIAIGDGTDYVKYEHNPIIDESMLPEGASKIDFRDPHIFKLQETYYCVATNRAADGSGELLVYKSIDALHWEFHTVLQSCNNELGRMWECPDFFESNGKYVVMLSPQEMEPVGLEFHGGNNTAVLIGDFDANEFSFKKEMLQAIDYGIDFYAPQVTRAEDGRQILIAWMENWTNVGCKKPQCRIFGAMTFPREVFVREDGRFMQNPVREITNYYGEKITYHNQRVEEEMSLKGISGNCFDMTILLTVDEDESSWFKLRLGKDKSRETVITYMVKEHRISVDRARSGNTYDIVHERSFYVADQKQIKLRILMDGERVELFVNDGEQAASFRLYEAGDGISFEAEKSLMMDVEKYEIVIDSNFKMQGEE